MLKLTVVALLVTLVVYETSGFTYMDYVKLEVLEDGSIAQYCEHGGKRFEVGQSQTAECIKCTCGHFMQCSGIGYKAGAISVSNCTMVTLDNCCYKFVDSADNTKPCADFPGEQCP